MKNASLLIMHTLAAALLATSSVVCAADKKMDFGKREFESNCANCHGLIGKGDGAFKHMLARSAPDLTTLARQNGGVFPTNRLYEVIDGREDMKFHGPREMPIWGRDYRLQAGEYYMDVPYDPEAYVRTRILALIDYVNRLQVK